MSWDIFTSHILHICVSKFHFPPKEVSVKDFKMAFQFWQKDMTVNLISNITIELLLLSSSKSDQFFFI